MKEIKKLSDDNMMFVNEKVKGFDIRKVGLKMVFDYINNSGLFVKVFSELTTFNVFDKDQITLKSFSYTYVEENDELIYPMADLILSVRDYDSGFVSDFCLSLTPFNAELNNAEKSAGVYGGCNKDLTAKWREIMKFVFKEKYVEEFKTYCKRVKNVRESAIDIEAMIKHAQNDDWYNDAVNSI